MDGNAGHRGRVLPHPTVAAAAKPPSKRPVIELDESEAPDDLSVDERHVWLELAPHAMVKGTLTPENSRAFRLLCRNVVLERRYAESVADAGGPSHRGMIQIVDRELRFFDLHGGKPVQGEENPAVDPLQEKYFAGGSNRA